MRFTVRTRQVLPAGLPEVMPFFAAADNLEQITPAWLAFSLTEGAGTSVAAGTRLVYRLRLFGVPLRWVTVIERFRSDLGFVDVQVEGPYRRWEHLHLFSLHGSGVLMEDRIDYELPFGPLGALAQPLVALQLAGIFRYRRRALQRYFPGQA
jgi:ligand-binding SRPBCC domain-containing protein